MTSKRAALIFADAVVVGVVVGFLVAPYVKRAVFALVAAGEARDIDAEWAELNTEADRGGRS